MGGLLVFRKYYPTNYDWSTETIHDIWFLLESFVDCQKVLSEQKLCLLIPGLLLFYSP